METFLGLLQDFCLHVCLTCNQSCGDSVDGHTSLQERKQHAHLLRQPDRSDDMREKSLCRLYYSHSVVSAILSAKQLVSSGRRGSTGPGGSIISKITLSKEDNSGTYFLVWWYVITIMHNVHVLIANGGTSVIPMGLALVHITETSIK